MHIPANSPQSKMQPIKALLQSLAIIGDQLIW